MVRRQQQQEEEQQQQRRRRRRRQGRGQGQVKGGKMSSKNNNDTITPTTTTAATNTATIIDDSAENEKKTLDETELALSFERASAELELLCAAYPDEIRIVDGGERRDENGTPLSAPTFALTLPDIGDAAADADATTTTTKTTTTTTATSGSTSTSSSSTASRCCITMQLPRGYPERASLRVASYRVSSNNPKYKSGMDNAISAVRQTSGELFRAHGGEEGGGGMESGLACCAAALDAWRDALETAADAEREGVENEKTGEERQTDVDDRITGKQSPNSSNDANWRKAAADHPTNLGGDDGDGDDSGMGIRWITGGTLIDRRSVFQAHVCQVRGDDTVKKALRALIGGSTKIQRATHNMYAYRFTERLPDGKTILKHDNDDDGEDGAGSRLAQLLQMRNEDGVLVVVTRWYGGVLLGPKRFAHIVNVARELLVRCHDDGSLGESLTCGSHSN